MRQNVFMNLPEFSPQRFHQLAARIDRSLNSHVDHDGREFLLAGPGIGFLARLDRLVWLSQATWFKPFVVTDSIFQDREDATGSYGKNNLTDWMRDTRTAHPNTWSTAAEEMAYILNVMSAHQSLFSASHPATGQLLLAPHLRLLMDVFFSHPICTCLDRDINDPVDFTGRIRAEVYNDFVDQFRAAMRSRKSLRHELHNWNVGSLENDANVSAYVDGLFAQHLSLTVLHIRLFHSKERLNPLTASAADLHRELQTLRACRTQFFDRMRRKPALFTANPGYVWAIMPSLEGGYDLYLTLLFDTADLQKVLDDKAVEASQVGVVLEDHADQIGRYWVTAATEGRGAYIRSDQNPWVYGRDAVHGEVCAGDAIRRARLKKMLGYLAMRRALVRLKGEPRGEYFGMRERKARASRRSVGGGEKAR